MRDNCFNTTFSLAEHFRGKTVDQDSPLYVASYWKEASTSLVKKVTDLPEQNSSIMQISVSVILPMSEIIAPCKALVNHFHCRLCASSKACFVSCLFLVLQAGLIVKEQGHRYLTSCSGADGLDIRGLSCSHRHFLVP